MSHGDKSKRADKQERKAQYSTSARTAAARGRHNEQRTHHQAHSP